MLIAGAGGHALEVFDVLCENNNKDTAIVFYDDCTPIKTVLGSHLVIKTQDDARKLFKNDPDFCLGVGDPESRKILIERLISLGGRQVALRSSLAEVSSRVEDIDVSVDIMKRALISSRVRLGHGSLINSGAQIHHEAIIGKFCEISPLALILGGARVGDFCRIGAGAILLPKVSICNNVTIGAGSIVVKDILSCGIYAGAPVKKLEPDDS
ncbi:MAG: acetyltransferase [Candidatus Omnitrophica bacterium]|nr:acetyltransferase [Candidatus Omnitrophota bacterium]